MVGGHVGAGTGQAVLRAELAALGVEHGLEVDQPAAKALVGQRGGVGGGSGGGLQALHPLAVVAQRHQGVFHLLQRGQHAGTPGFLRLVDGGLLGPLLAAQRAAVEHRQADAGQQCAGHRAAAGQSTERERGESQRARQPQRRAQRRIGLRQRGPGGGQAVFGGAHIGPLAQGVGRAGQCQCGARLRHRRGGGQRGVQRRRRLAGQHRQRMAGLGHCGLQRWQAGGGLCTGGLGLLGRQPVHQAGLQAPAGDLQRVLLAGQVGLGDRQPGLGAAQADVGQRHLGRQRHLRGAQAGGAGVGGGGAGGQGAALATEQVSLPAGVQAGAEAVAGAVAGAAALGIGPGGQPRAQAGGGHVLQGAGLPQRGLGAAHAGVGIQRLRDQRGQQRVIELLPPGQQGSAVSGRTSGRRCASPTRRQRGRPVGRRGRGGAGAAGQQQGQAQQGGRQGPAGQGIQGTPHGSRRPSSRHAPILRPACQCGMSASAQNVRGLPCVKPARRGAARRALVAAAPPCRGGPIATAVAAAPAVGPPRPGHRPGRPGRAADGVLRCGRAMHTGR